MYNTFGAQVYHLNLWIFALPNTEFSTWKKLWDGDWENNL